MKDLKVHVKKNIERLKERMKETPSENFRNYLEGKCDAYEDMLLILMEGEEE